MNALQAQLLQWQKAHPKPEPSPRPVLRIYEPQKKEIVAGGEVLWKPVNREAAKLLAKASWIHHPPEPGPIYEKKISNPRHAPSPARDEEGDHTGPRSPRAKPKKRKKKPMKGNLSETTITQEGGMPPNQKDYVSKDGVRIKMVNGEPMFNLDDMSQWLALEIAKLPKETRPNVQAAEDARKIIAELTQGIGGEMEKFRADTKRYLEDIRQVRFAVVTETAQMTGPLKEVRQFFLGGDYKEEVARLKEFVDLCERLQKLKESGFLDSVADTMLRLAV